MANQKPGVIDQLLIALGVDTNDASFKHAKTQVLGLMDAVGGVALGAQAAVVGLFALARAQAEVADTAGMTAADLGVNVEVLTAYGAAAERAGSSQEAMTAALGQAAKLSRMMSVGTGDLAEGLFRLGIGFEEIRKQRPEVIFERVVAALRRLPNETDRAVYAERVLGGGAEAALRLARTGEALSDLTDEAREFGAVISEADAKLSRKFMADLSALGQAFRGIIRSIGLGIVPVFQRWVTGMLEWRKANKELIDGTVRKAVDVLTQALRQLEGPLGVVVALFAAWGTYRAASGLAALAIQLPVIGAAAAGLKGTALAMLGLAAAVLAIDDVVVTAKGGKSLMRRLFTVIFGDEGPEYAEKYAQTILAVANAVDEFARSLVSLAASQVGADEFAARVKEGRTIPETGEFQKFSEDKIRDIATRVLDQFRQFGSLQPQDPFARTSADGWSIGTVNVNVTGGADPAAIREATREGIIEAARQVQSDFGGQPAEDAP